jgi:hypothetical protein
MDKFRRLLIYIRITMLLFALFASFCLGQDATVTRRIISVKPVDDSALKLDSLPLGPVGIIPWSKEQVGNKARITLGGWGSYVGKLYDDVFEESVCVTEGLKHIAYFARNQNTFLVVVDDRDEPSLENSRAGKILLSNDGSQVFVLYTLIRKPASLSSSAIENRFLVRNGKIVPDGEFFKGTFEDPFRLPFAFSSDGAHYAYSVPRDGEWRVYLDGQIVGVHNASVSRVVFGPDNRRIAYILGEGRQCAVFDGRQGPWLDGIQWNYDAYPVSYRVFFFSPDGKHVAYAGIKDGKKVVILDQFVERYAEDNIYGITFSPDGSRIAVVTPNRGNISTPYQVSYNGRSFSVPQGFPIAAGCHFNSDGAHLAAVMHNTIIVDGVPGPVFEFITSVNFLVNRLQYIASTRTSAAGGNISASKYYLIEEEISPLETNSEDKNELGSKE